MPLPAVVENLEEIPEIARDEYKPDADGKRYVREVPGAAEDDLGALKRALEREKAERRKYARLAEEKGAIDPEEYRALKAAAEEQERAKAMERGQFDKLLAQKDQEYAKERAKWEADMRAALSSVERHVLDAEIAQAVASNKGKLKLLAPLVKAQLKAINEGGSYRVAVVDADGDERHNPKTNAPMTVAELVAEMRQDPEFGGAFEASGATGGGAAASGVRAGGPKVMSRATFDGMNPIQRLEFIKGGGSVADTN